jgi:hypothetical protein
MPLVWASEAAGASAALVVAEAALPLVTGAVAMPILLESARVGQKSQVASILTPYRNASKQVVGNPLISHIKGCMYNLSHCRQCVKENRTSVLVGAELPIYLAIFTKVALPARIAAGSHRCVLLAID